MLASVSKVNLLGFDRKALQDLFISLGEKSFRADQVFKWIHFQGILAFDKMTNISKQLQQYLSAHTHITVPEVIYDHATEDGTRKWLLKLADGNCIETVFIPENNRGTLCISSQVGCVLNCDFCSTGKQGFNRNLSTAEILAQLWLAVRYLSANNGLHDHQITNVVMMGMGEPLLNLENLLPALNVMQDDFAYGLSKRRVTVSTAGVIPMLYELRQKSDVALAISLHAPTDELRNQLVPINKKYPLKELMAACKTYFQDNKRRTVMIEYVMLAGINDSLHHAKQLIKLLNNMKVKVNLIPFNPFPQTTYQCSDIITIQNFRDRLLAADIHTTIRKTRGQKMNAACGQLVGQVKDRSARQKQHGIKQVEN